MAVRCSCRLLDLVLFGNARNRFYDLNILLDGPPIISRTMPSPTLT